MSDKSPMSEKPKPPQTPAARDDFDANIDTDTIDRELRLAQILKSPVTATWWLLGVNIAIWVIAWFWGNTLGIVTPYFNNEQLVLFTGMKVNELLEAGQWWRLISSQFVHLDIMHIAFNGYGLYVLGPMIERFFGWRRFLVLYLVSGTVGALASFWFTQMPSGGASGAIYGLVGALLVIGLKYRKQLPKRVSKAFTVGMLPWVVLSLGIGFLDSLPMDNAAHLGGLFSGGMMVFVFRTRLRQQARSLRDYAVWACTALAFGGLLWTTAHWTQEVAKCAVDGRDAYFACYPELEEQLEVQE
jgi:membrane associated rhomboid family serine protease